MERLTFRGTDGHAESCEPINCLDEYSNVARNICIDRLAAYEDICYGAGGMENISLARLRELAEADKDGRCVVLLCKVGDDMFSHRWSVKAQKYEVCAGEIKNVRHDSADGLVTVSDGEKYCIWGKTAFPTYSAAEAALKAGEPR